MTGTLSTFAVPITGTASPNPDTLPNPITLSNTSVTIGVDSTLIGAGVTTGLVSAADSLADLGVIANDGTPNQNAGIDAVTSAIGSVTLKITGSNTVEGTQTAANPAAAALTFYVTADALGGSVVVYSSVTNPPVLGGPNVSDPTRTGTVLVGSLNVLIPLGDTIWTPNGGGSVAFSEAAIVPSTTTTPIPSADVAAAPLVLLPKINGAISVPFHCWNGTASVDGLSFTPGAASAIDTVTVNVPPTAPDCSPTTRATSVGGGQAVDVSASCTDVNGDFTPSNTSVIVAPGTATAPAGQNPNGVNGYPAIGAVVSPVAPAHGTVSVAPSGLITYTNNGDGTGTDSFEFVVTDAAGLVSQTVTVNIGVLNNLCTASPSCSLQQVLVLPVLPSTLSMSEAAAYGNPDFSHAVLGGVVTGTGCVPGPMVLNGQPQTACGALNPLTVINARGTDALWSVTGQVTDFIDGTRGPTDTCSPGRNIDQVPPDNHCVPGGNLGWIPVAQILDPSVPGDTAAIVAGPVILPPGTTAQTPPTFPPDLIAPRQNTNSVVAPAAGLHDAAQALCTAPANQSGGTFQCDAGLLLDVPGSTAAGTYIAIITLTLA